MKWFAFALVALMLAAPAAAQYQITESVIGSGGTDALTIVAEPGDTSAVDTAGQEATHTALILADDRAVLGLRFHHPGDREDIAIIGFWVPQAP